MTGRSTVPPDGLTLDEYVAVMRAFNPDADSLVVPACYVVDAPAQDDSREDEAFVARIEALALLDEEPSPVEVEIARMFDAALVTETVPGRIGEHVAPLPFVLDLDDSE